MRNLIHPYIKIIHAIEHYKCHLLEISYKIVAKIIAMKYKYFV